MPERGERGRTGLHHRVAETGRRIVRSSVHVEELMKLTNAALLSAAVSGIFCALPGAAAASPSAGDDATRLESPGASPLGDTADAGAKHACKGQNACKGQG